ncbi:transcriptional regulator [Paenarthrobacter sp. Z7-10]|uniref:AfsR/SARP family transcriptional regulator n=1 Tax=Paenarthrobacter sp. Z7-10 TaxID=2787635 RepID=UPI0022A95AED|nr:BTAD domain-containing putative transcriptional regulator [Paenarthrobacter sp. Z7-10]MCZ2405056.1 transcriptional regulator [Paenarthrobacter sp. Z7-10]
MTDISWSLNLLGCWQLSREGRTVRVGIRQQRLIGALALLGPRPRSAVAGLLWPDSSEPRATASLRVAVWHVAHEYPGLLRNGENALALSSAVDVDVDRLQRSIGAAPQGVPVRALLEQLRTAELLPGWYEDWILDEQERMRHVRLTALDALTRRLLDAADPAAQEAALITVSLEPLRTASNELLIRAQLAAGNYNAAVRAFDLFRWRTLEAFGTEPSIRFNELARTGSLVLSS